MMIAASRFMSKRRVFMGALFVAAVAGFYIILTTLYLQYQDSIGVDTGDVKTLLVTEHFAFLKNRTIHYQSADNAWACQNVPFDPSVYTLRPSPPPITYKDIAQLPLSTQQRHKRVHVSTPLLVLPVDHGNIHMPHPDIPLCVRVVVPPPLSATALSSGAVDIRNVYTPLMDHGWDSITLEFIGVSTGITVPVVLRPTINGQVIDSNLDPFALHFYEGEVLLRDKDVYRPVGYVEFQTGLWNFEPGLPLPNYSPVPLAVAMRSDLNGTAGPASTDNSSTEDQDSLITSIPPLSSPSPSPSTQSHLEQSPSQSPSQPSDIITVSLLVSKDHAYHLENYLSLPFCTMPNPKGRWLPVSMLPFDKSHVAGQIDNLDRAFIPYNCRLKRYTETDFVGCLKGRYPDSHWFGDSNIRRALKKITSLGTWCTNVSERSTRNCICEDSAENFGPFNHWFRDNLIYINTTHQGIPVLQSNYLLVGDNYTQVSSLFHADARINFHKFDGLSHYNNPPWYEVFDPAPHFQHPLMTLTPELLVVSLTNWDVAFMTFSDYASQLNLFINKLQGMYPVNRTYTMVWRTGQYYCCRIDPTKHQRRYSTERIRHFDEYTYMQLKKVWPDLLKWDVNYLQATRQHDERVTSSECASGHSNSYMVDVENQLLFNALCNGIELDDIDL
ncbi:hypothetical protein EV182_002694 [Spiromyces aspiralis]|uniref:Uncharacterized protein n=1 Tax=Spiromyces aspiralis TaxID=68401 RepID=A0ACC1HHY1_9FUNG|nr:hypothetical protein EV182_002694 [Spiromyces aspiralis]